jgi:putative membrane protein
LQKSSNDDVKKFAQKMVDDHTALNDSLAPIAKSMGVKPPKKLAKGDQAELNKLNGLSGADFDKEYIAYMLKDHKKDLADFHQEAGTAGTPDLKAAVSKGESTIHEHLEMVEKIAQTNGIQAAK